MASFGHCAFRDLGLLRAGSPTPRIGLWGSHVWTLPSLHASRLTLHVSARAHQVPAGGTHLYNLPGARSNCEPTPISERSHIAAATPAGLRVRSEQPPAEAPAATVRATALEQCWRIHCSRARRGGPHTITRQCHPAAGSVVIATAYQRRCYESLSVSCTTGCAIKYTYMSIGQSLDAS